MHKSQSRKILIIDDHLLFAEGLKAQLKALPGNIKIVINTNGKNALSLLRTRPDFHLIILDLSMPELDGRKVLSVLSRRKIGCPILVITAHLDHLVAKEVIKLGASGYLGKNASPKLMIEAAKQVLAGRVYVDPNLPKVVLRNQDSRGSENPECSNSPRGIPPRTLEVLNLMARGHSNKSIANVLTISEATVKWHVSRLFEVFEVQNRTACVAKAARGKFVEIE